MRWEPHVPFASQTCADSMQVSTLAACFIVCQSFPQFQGTVDVGPVERKGQGGRSGLSSRGALCLGFRREDD